MCIDPDTGLSDVRRPPSVWVRTGRVLELKAEDDSEVILDADTGIDATVSIHLSSEAGTEQFIQPWSLRQGVSRRAP